MPSSKTYLALSLLLLAWAVAATTGLALYFNEAQTYRSLYEEASRQLDQVSVQVDLMVKYPDGRREWFNATRIPLGYSLLNATATVVPVDYEVAELGAFVTAINRVAQDPEKSLYWLWYRWTPDGWVLGEVGADSYLVKDGDVLAWVLADTSSWPPPPP